MHYLAPSLFVIVSIIALPLSGSVHKAAWYRGGGLVASFVGLLLIVLEGKGEGTMFAVLHLLLSTAAFATLPRRVLERRETPLLFLLNGLVLVLVGVRSHTLFALGYLLVQAALVQLTWIEAQRHKTDPKRHYRFSLYVIFTGISALGLMAFVLSRALGAGEIVGDLGLFVALISGVGLFPFHSWVPLFLAGPRLDSFLPIFRIELGVLLLVRLFLPLKESIAVVQPLVLCLSAIGLIYFAVLLFGATQLKNIVGYLVLSHLSLMVLALSMKRSVDVALVHVDAINLLIAATGLIVILTVMTARFGREGTLTPSGLARHYPEVSICFLACTLSLVGFPGTIGYVSEELLFKGAFEYETFLLPVIVIALALNSYSAFRIFARSFYGTPTYPGAASAALATRERVGLLLIVFLLIVNGLMPRLILSLG